jgi:hypothetical protein
MALTSIVISDSGAHMTQDYIFLSHDCGDHATALFLQWILCQHNRSWFWVPQDSWPYFSDSQANCCWPSPPQSFLVKSPAGLMTIFYCLTNLKSCNSIHHIFLSRWLFLCSFNLDWLENTAHNTSSTVVCSDNNTAAVQTQDINNEARRFLCNRSKVI